ncbi:unnamed protein product [Hyaloperonospora brassicae]|uniref:Uncharacterized protein n=1 Tax=Hyaloperonospora brassicae TaxID=162125 RepID=A0AAV0TI65_HYABA|nr:unnamed protein product [Hyaloperonospora brassicae]
MDTNVPNLINGHTAPPLLRANAVPTRQSSRSLVASRAHKDRRLKRATLVAALCSLTATVQQQLQTMCAQEAAFALQQAELETLLEETQAALQTERRRAADADLERQAVQEQFAFVQTQVEGLLRDRAVVGGSQTAPIGKRLDAVCIESDERVAVLEVERRAEAQKRCGRCGQRELQLARAVRTLAAELQDAQERVAACERACAAEKSAFEKALADAVDNVRGLQLDTDDDSERRPRGGRRDESSAAQTAHVGVRQLQSREERTACAVEQTSGARHRSRGPSSDQEQHLMHWIDSESCLPRTPSLVERLVEPHDSNDERVGTAQSAEQRNASIRPVASGRRHSSKGSAKRSTSTAFRSRSASTAIRVPDKPL